MGKIETIFSDDGVFASELAPAVDEFDSAITSLLDALEHHTATSDLTAELAAIEEKRIALLQLVDGRLGEEPDPSHGGISDERDPEDTYDDYISALTKLSLAIDEPLEVGDDCANVEAVIDELRWRDLGPEAIWALQDYIAVIERYNVRQAEDMAEWEAFEKERAAEKARAAESNIYKIEWPADCAVDRRPQ